MASDMELGLWQDYAIACQNLIRIAKVEQTDEALLHTGAMLAAQQRLDAYYGQRECAEKRAQELNDTLRDISGSLKTS